MFKMNGKWIEVFELWDKLSLFVYETCKNRKEDHGYEHMETVTINSLKLFSFEFENKLHQNDEEINSLIKDIIMVAWLHDVADHKFDKNNELMNTVYEFLKQISNKPDLIMSIIERISYSKEAKIIKNNEKLDWAEVLGDYGCLIRDIVSDSDKLEALGKNGFERCVEYTKNNYKEKHNQEIPYELLKKLVKEHADEKLLKLKDHYIRTDYGKKMATSLHDELLIEINKM